MRELNYSKPIIELIGQVWNEDDPISYTNKNFFSVEYIPATVQEAKTFVCFDMAGHLNKNRTYHDFTIWFFISCHTSAMNIATGLRFDKIVSELEQIFNDKNVLGLGKGIFTDNVPYSANNNFRGRMLTYKIFDFSKGG